MAARPNRPERSGGSIPSRRWSCEQKQVFSPEAPGTVGGGAAVLVSTQDEYRVAKRGGRCTCRWRLAVQHGRDSEGWLRQHERDTGKRDGVTTAEQERIRALEREVRAAAPGPPRSGRKAKASTAHFAQAASLDRPFQTMGRLNSSFIAARRSRGRRASICKGSCADRPCQIVLTRMRAGGQVSIRRCDRSGRRPTRYRDTRGSAGRQPPGSTGYARSGGSAARASRRCALYRVQRPMKRLGLRPPVRGHVLQHDGERSEGAVPAMIT